MNLSPTFTFGTLDGRLKRAVTERVIDELRRVHPKGVFNIETLSNPAAGKGRSPELYSAHSPAELDLLQEKLLAGACDLIVCSACDMMRPVPDGLTVAAVPERSTPFDALLNTTGDIADDLPPNASIGVLSRRSQAQVGSLWERVRAELLPGGAVMALRDLLNEGRVDNRVLPASVAEMLGVQDRVSEIFFPEMMLPGPGQGLLAVLARDDDKPACEAIEKIHSNASYHEMLAELALRERICSDQDCPVGALAQVNGQRIVITGAVGSASGDSLHRAVLEGPVESAAELGVRLAEKLMSRTDSLINLLEADFPEGLPEEDDLEFNNDMDDQAEPLDDLEDLEDLSVLDDLDDD